MNPIGTVEELQSLLRWLRVLGVEPASTDHLVSRGFEIVQFDGWSLARSKEPEAIGVPYTICALHRANHLTIPDVAPWLVLSLTSRLTR